MSKDPLRESVEMSAKLWRGGRVVWGVIVQANAGIYSPGDTDLPGAVLFDSTGRAPVPDLIAANKRLQALKGTQPDDLSLFPIAHYLTSEVSRNVGLPVPMSISPHGLVISTVLLCRKHLPSAVLCDGLLPILVNDQLPGIAMIFPSRWWPKPVLSIWQEKAPSTAQLLARVPGQAQTGERCCGHCQTPMLKLGLAAHYNKTVEIDVCESCTLIWFDDTESVRLAGPGLTDLVRIISESFNSPRPLQPMPLQLPCPICREPLRRVANLSRFGRTSHLECPHKHGFYQTFTLFLAEKGYFRRYTWADIKKITDLGRRISCINCGAELSSKPQDECLYCQSPVGLIDPTRLARALDTAGAAPTLSLALEHKQAQCPCCGGAIDLHEETVCPHCKAVVAPGDIAAAVEAVKEIEDSVRDNYERQSAEVSRRKLELEVQTVRLSNGVSNIENFKRLAIFILMAITLIYVGVGTMRFRQQNPVHEEEQDMSLSPELREQLRDARIKKDMAKIRHAAAGVVPPELTITKDVTKLTVTSTGNRHIGITVGQFNDNGTHCPMVRAEEGNSSGLAVFTKQGQSAIFYPGTCSFSNPYGDMYEFVVWDTDTDTVIFKSDSAFR